MAAIGINEAKLMATNAATLSKPSSEYWTVFPEYSVPSGFLFAFSKLPVLGRTRNAYSKIPPDYPMVYSDKLRGHPT